MLQNISHLSIKNVTKHLTFSIKNATKHFTCYNKEFHIFQERMLRNIPHVSIKIVTTHLKCFNKECYET
jgi:hypothetical protein